MRYRPRGAVSACKEGQHVDQAGTDGLTATIGTTALTATASADEHTVAYDNNRAGFQRGYDHDGRFDRVDGRFDRVDGRFDRVDGRFGVREGSWARRRAYEEMMRERRERAIRHARWLRMHNGGGYRGW